MEVWRLIANLKWLLFWALTKNGEAEHGVWLSRNRVLCLGCCREIALPRFKTLPLENRSLRLCQPEFSLSGKYSITSNTQRQETWPQKWFCYPHPPPNRSERGHHSIFLSSQTCSDEPRNIHSADSTLEAWPVSQSSINNFFGSAWVLYPTAEPRLWPNLRPLECSSSWT